MNILLIDDDVSSLKNLTTSIKPSGHQCEGFSDPLEALAVYEQQQYDVVITDMRMPGINGIEVLKRVRGLNPGAKVILITAYGDVDTAVAAVNNKAYAFLSKPINFDELMSLLGKIDQESSQEKDAVDNKARLLLHYAKLKQAYQDLQALTNKKF